MTRVAIAGAAPAGSTLYHLSATALVWMAARKWAESSGAMSNTGPRPAAAVSSVDVDVNTYPPPPVDHRSDLTASVAISAQTQKTYWPTTTSLALLGRLA